MRGAGGEKREERGGKRGEERREIRGVGGEKREERGGKRGEERR